MTTVEAQAITDRARQKLFRRGQTSRSELIEQYKIYLELADKISERRAHANSFCLTINAGLFAVLGYIYSKDALTVVKSIAVFVPMTGVIVCIFWGLLVTSYRQLNSAKFRVVHLMEEELAAAPYAAEWEELGGGVTPRKYMPLSAIETMIPIAAGAMHILVLFLLPK